MKPYHSNIYSPSILSPKVNIYNLPFSELLSSLSHHRCLSAKISPYQNQESLDKFRSFLKSTSRYHSPKLSTLKKPAKKIFLKKKVKTKSAAVLHRKKKSSNVNLKKRSEKLKDLSGKKIVYAPKIFKNQIFSDVYDSAGNHDRLVEMSNHSKDFMHFENILTQGTLIVPANVEIDSEKTEKNLDLRQPENSYLEETKLPHENYQDIFKKLSVLAFNQKEETEHESF